MSYELTVPALAALIAAEPNPSVTAKALHSSYPR